MALSYCPTPGCEARIDRDAMLGSVCRACFQQLPPDTRDQLVREQGRQRTRHGIKP